jgi:Chaperone of endosialidase
MKTKDMTTLHLRIPIGCSPLRFPSLLVALTLACFAFSPAARAVCQQGCDASLGNTFLGEDALISNTGGYNNAIGDTALYHNTTGSENTATGSAALWSNTSGVGNTATGHFTLFYNSTGYYNTATGDFALIYNTTGSRNTATGLIALNNNTTGNDNTGTGSVALYSNKIGYENTATGANALYSNTNGYDNTADGFDSLYYNTKAHANTAIGHHALFNNKTGNFNIALGANAGFELTSGSNNIDIYNRGVAGESNTIRIGTAETHTATFVAGISGATVPGGIGVIVDSSGHLGTSTSSARFKEGIKPMDNASEALFALQPVTFRYKKDLDPACIPQFGLVAEEVEKVNPDLVVRDEQGKPYSVRYEAVNAMLLNEFLKEHRKVENLKKDFEATVAQQQKEIASLAATVKEQAAQIQKVSAQLEASKPAPQVVNNL